MKQIVVAVSLVVISAMAPIVEAQQGVEKAATGTLVAPAEALNSLLNMTESQMISLVKAFPADKYGFAPSAAIFAPGQQTEYAGVRTFGALVIHVAQANYILGSRLSGLKPDIDPTTLAKLSSKDEIVAALETSFAFDHKAIGTITNANAFESVGGRAPSGATIPSTRCTQAAYIAVHASDEYGQMVEYQRMNGITPPASGAPAPPQKSVSLDSTMQTGKEEYQHAQPSSELFGGCLSRSERIRDCEATSVQIGPFAQASPTLWRPFHIVGLSHPVGMQAHGDYAPIR